MGRRIEITETTVDADPVEAFNKIFREELALVHLAILEWIGLFCHENSTYGPCGNLIEAKRRIKIGDNYVDMIEIHDESGNNNGWRYKLYALQEVCKPYFLPEPSYEDKMSVGLFVRWPTGKGGYRYMKTLVPGFQAVRFREMLKFIEENSVSKKN